MCEVMPFYPDDQRVWSSVFFNNYGVRSMHEDAGVVSWNWGAPFLLGFNCICVNGKTCICLASSLMTLSELRQIRDHAEFILRGYINMGDEHLVGYEDNAEFLHALPAPSVLKRE